MENNAVAWATSEGMMLPDQRTDAKAVATTAAGHVIAVGEKRGDAGGQFIVKLNGADGTVVWSNTYAELDGLSGMESVGEMGYVTGKLAKSTGTEAFATATNGLGGLSSSCDSGAGDSASVFAIDASGADGPAFTWMTQALSLLGLTLTLTLTLPLPLTQIGCGTGYSVKVEGDFLYISGELD